MSETAYNYQINDISIDTGCVNLINSNYDKEKDSFFRGISVGFSMAMDLRINTYLREEMFVVTDTSINNIILEKISEIKSDLSKKIDESNEKITKMEDKFDNRFDKLDEKLSNKIDKLDDKVNDIDKRLTVIEKVNSLESINKRIKEERKYTLKITGLSVVIVSIVVFVIDKWLTFGK